VSRNLLAGLAIVMAVLNLPSSAAGAESEAMPQAPRPEQSESLTAEDREILDRGEYSRGDIVVSGLLGTLVGFGSGHVHQGRFKERGWIFLAGEGSVVVGATAGMAGCAAGGESFGSATCFGTVALTGLSLLAAFKLWEIIDVWSHPPLHNRRYREIEARRAEKISWSLHVGPNGDGGVSAGLGFRF